VNETISFASQLVNNETTPRYETSHRLLDRGSRIRRGQSINRSSSIKKKSSAVVRRRSSLKKSSIKRRQSIRQSSVPVAAKLEKFNLLEKSAVEVPPVKRRSSSYSSPLTTRFNEAKTLEVPTVKQRSSSYSSPLTTSFNGTNAVEVPTVKQRSSSYSSPLATSFNETDNVEVPDVKPRPRSNSNPCAIPSFVSIRSGYVCSPVIESPNINEGIQNKQTPLSILQKDKTYRRDESRKRNFSQVEAVKENNSNQSEISEIISKIPRVSNITTKIPSYRYKHRAAKNKRYCPLGSLRNKQPIPGIVSSHHTLEIPKTNETIDIDESIDDSIFDKKELSMPPAALHKRQRLHSNFRTIRLDSVKNKRKSMLRLKSPLSVDN